MSYSPDKPDTFEGKIGDKFTLTLIDKKNDYELTGEKKSNPIGTKDPIGYSCVDYHKGAPATVTYVVVKGACVTSTQGVE